MYMKMFHERLSKEMKTQLTRVAANLSDIHQTFSTKGKVMMLEDLDMVLMRQLINDQESNASVKTSRKQKKGKTININEVHITKKRDKKVRDKLESFELNNSDFRRIQIEVHPQGSVDRKDSRSKSKSKQEVG